MKGLLRFIKRSNRTTIMVARVVHASIMISAGRDNLPIQEKVHRIIDLYVRERYKVGLKDFNGIKKKVSSVDDARSEAASARFRYVIPRKDRTRLMIDEDLHVIIVQEAARYGRGIHTLEVLNYRFDFDLGSDFSKIPNSCMGGV